MAKLLSLMASVDRFLALIIKPIVVVLSFSIAVLLTYGIFTRSVLNKPVFGLEELVLFGAMWLYMLGAALASRERSHLSADFMQVIFKNPRVIHSTHIVASLISLFMAIMFSTWSYELVHWAVEKGQTTTALKLPWYLSQSSLFVASILFIFYQARDIINDLNSFRSTAKADRNLEPVTKQ